MKKPTVQTFWRAVYATIVDAAMLWIAFKAVDTGSLPTVRLIYFLSGLTALCGVLLLLVVIARDGTPSVIRPPWRNWLGNGVSVVLVVYMVANGWWWCAFGLLIGAIGEGVSMVTQEQYEDRLNGDTQP